MVRRIVGAVILCVSVAAYTASLVLANLVYDYYAILLVLSGSICAFLFIMAGDMFTRGYYDDEEENDSNELDD